MFPNLVAWQQTIRTDISGYADVLHFAIPLEDITRHSGKDRHGRYRFPSDNKSISGCINRIFGTHTHTRGAKRFSISTHIVLLAYGSLTKTIAWSSKRTRVEYSFFGETALNRSIVFSIHVDLCIKSPGGFFSSSRWPSGARGGLRVEQPNHADLLRTVINVALRCFPLKPPSKPPCSWVETLWWPFLTGRTLKRPYVVPSLPAR